MKIGSKEVRVLPSHVPPHPSCCFYAKGRWKGQSAPESVARWAHWASFRRRRVHQDKYTKGLRVVQKTCHRESDFSTGDSGHGVSSKSRAGLARWAAPCSFLSWAQEGLQSLPGGTRLWPQLPWLWGHIPFLPIRSLYCGDCVISAPSYTGGGASGPHGEGCHRPGILTPELDGVQGYTLPPVPVCSMHEKMGYVLFGGKGAFHGIF